MLESLKVALGMSLLVAVGNFLDARKCPKYLVTMAYVTEKIETFKCFRGLKVTEIWRSRPSKPVWEFSFDLLGMLYNLNPGLWGELIRE